MEEGKPIEDAYLSIYDGSLSKEQERESDPEWQKDNMEYDLRTSDYIAEKCKDEVYAQNLYAAMCNNDFVKNDVWPILTDKRWSCSWRYAGGIVAHIRQEGDYIDWYCSGIRNDQNYDPKLNITYTNGYVPESVITEEIEQDLLKLGWISVRYEGE